MRVFVVEHFPQRLKGAGLPPSRQRDADFSVKKARGPVRRHGDLRVLLAGVEDHLNLAAGIGRNSRPMSRRAWANVKAVWAAISLAPPSYERGDKVLAFFESCLRLNLALHALYPLRKTRDVGLDLQGALQMSQRIGVFAGFIEHLSQIRQRGERIWIDGQSGFKPAGFRSPPLPNRMRDHATRFSAREAVMVSATEAGAVS